MSSPVAAPLLPDTAPFAPGQRAWLNGFLAGLIGGGQSPAPDTAVLVPSNPAPQAPPEDDFPWHDAALPIDERLELARGRPHELVLMAAMAQLDCGACGYLCRTYAQAIASGAERDLTRCAPGGRETAARLRVLVKSRPTESTQPTVTAPRPAAARAPAEVKYGRNNPYPARFVSSTPLTAAGSDKDVRHVVLDIKDSGITYKPGDSLGVLAENCPESVQAVIDLLGAKGAEDVPGLDAPHASLREALLRDYTITRPTHELLELLARHAREPADAARLGQLIRDADGAAPEGLQVEDLLLQFRSARPAPAELVSTLAPLQPRLYSISSSQRCHPDQVHLTVAVVKYVNPFGRPCKGVASVCLGERMRPGQRVRVFVQPSERFSLPSDDGIPIIMIGPGTGVAPFRAFLQERKAAGHKGLAWLFFGDRTEAHDFLYRQDLHQFLRDGVLTRLDTAFSRDQAEKSYVQHRMLRHAAELWNWLTTGACVYVCGDAKRMAGDVDRALHRIVAEQGRLSEAQAKEFVANLARNRRYQRDVY